MRKAQVTLFVILGLVILIVAGFFLYMNYANKTPTGPERTDVSEQFEPIQLFVENCMESVARDAIERLGKHGGYIDPEDAYLSGRLFYTNADDQSESDLAYLSDTNPIAYWYYSYSEVGCDDCLMMSQAPYIDEIERQISIYVSENIDLCLDDFQSFRDKGFDLSTEDLMYVKTTLREQDVLIESIYNINLTYKESKASIEKYIATVDIPLMKYYDMALNITSQEYSSQFLEGLNSYIIGSYSGLDSELFPPFYAYTSSYDIVFWTKSKVKNNMNQLLSSYVPLMQVKGSKNYHQISKNLTLLEKNFINLITLDLFPGKSLQKTDISFNYLGDLSMDINPSKQELLGPFEDYGDGSSYSIAPPDKSNSYQFFYDVSYPVIVEINDEYAPGQYYTFMFALESTLKQNLPLKEWYNASKRPIFFDQKFFTAKFNDPLAGQKIVDSKTGKEYVYKQRPQDTLFCDPTQRTSGEVYVKTYDASTKQPLKDVFVSFGCGNYAVCPMGTTAYDQDYGVHAFSGILPICMNGYVRLEKIGYKEKNIKLTTSSSDSNMGSVYLEPIKKINVSISVYPVQRVEFNTAGNSVTAGYLLASNPTKPGINDTITVTFTKIISGLEESLVQTVFMSPEANITQIELVPGRYAVKANYLAGEGFIIPKECMEVCESYLLGICTKYKQIPDKSIEIKPALIGGIEFDTAFPFNVKRDDLNKQNLELFVLRMPNPRCLNDMEEINKLSSVTKSNSIKLMPKFK